MIGDYWLLNELAKERQTTIRREAKNSETGILADNFGKVSAVAISLFFVLSVIF